MKPFNNILVIVSGDPEPGNNLAVEKGINIIRQNGGQMTLMDVIAVPDEMANEYDGMFSTGELFDMFVNQRQGELQGVAEQLCSQGLDVRSTVASGWSFIEVIRQVLSSGHDLVIKVANKSSESFDGNDFHLMRKCPQPVWLLKPDHNDSPPKRALVAIDLAQEAYDEGKHLNRRILNIANAFAQQQGYDLHLLSCWLLYGENTLRHSAFMRVSDEKLASILDAEAKQNKVLQQQLINEVGSGPIESHLLKGDATELIPQFAQENDFDVVIMGTVGRTGIPGFFIGNTAENILHKIEASVITVKPEGFESPVTLD